MPRKTQDLPAGTTYFQVPLARDNASDVFKKDMSGLTAYQRHKKFVGDYLSFYGKGAVEELQKRASNSYVVGKTDLDILRDNHRFLRDESDDGDTSWEARVAKTYYKKLFKEYCLANLSRYKTSQIALRWRTQKEVVQGKGQFICGNLTCNEHSDLRSWEVNFAYMEDGERKNALVKLRLCPSCSIKLHYKKIKEAKKHEKEESKKRRIIEKERERKRQRPDNNQVNHPEELPVTNAEHVDAADEGNDESDEEGDKRVLDSLNIKRPGEQYSKEEISRIWSAPQPEETDEKSTVDEIDAYFADLFD